MVRGSERGSQEGSHEAALAAAPRGLHQAARCAGWVTKHTKGALGAPANPQTAALQGVLRGAAAPWCAWRLLRVARAAGGFVANWAHAAGPAPGGKARGGMAA